VTVFRGEEGDNDWVRSVYLLLTCGSDSFHLKKKTPYISGLVFLYQL
jgi:hypothetical protein